LHCAALAADRMHGTRGLCVEAVPRITGDLPEPVQGFEYLLELTKQRSERLAGLREALAPFEAGEPGPDPAEGRLWQRYEAAARCTWNAALGKLRAMQADRRRDEPARPGPAPRRPNEANARPATMSLYEATGGADPTPVIARLRARLRAMAEAGHYLPEGAELGEPNEPNAGPGAEAAAAPTPPRGSARDEARSGSAAAPTAEAAPGRRGPGRASRSAAPAPRAALSGPALEAGSTSGRAHPAAERTQPQSADAVKSAVVHLLARGGPQ
jgi:hypothetical protein